MRLSQQSIEQKLQEVPQDVQDLVSSEIVANKISDVVRRNGLHIDQAGILEEEALYLMLGLQGAQDFVEKLRDRMRISHNSAISIAEDINKNVFTFIREDLRKSRPAQPPEQSLQDDAQGILNEIENPEPSVHPISRAADSMGGAQKPREIISPHKDEIAKEFVSGKLNETVRMPTQKTNIDLKPPQNPQYKNDPYREQTG